MYLKLCDVRAKSPGLKLGVEGRDQSSHMEKRRDSLCEKAHEPRGARLLLREIQSVVLLLF